MFCNSSCILLLGINQKQTFKCNKHGNGISFISLKKVFLLFWGGFFPRIFFAFHSRSEVLVLALQLETVWVFYACFTTPAHLHFICWEMTAVSNRTRFRQSTGTHVKFLPSQIFPSIFLCQHSQLCITYQARSD